MSLPSLGWKKSLVSCFAAAFKGKKGFLGKSVPGKLHTLLLKESITWGALGMGRASWAVGSSVAAWLFPGQQETGASPPQGSRG